MYLADSTNISRHSTNISRHSWLRIPEWVFSVVEEHASSLSYVMVYLNFAHFDSEFQWISVTDMTVADSLYQIPNFARNVTEFLNGLSVMCSVSQCVRSRRAVYSGNARARHRNLPRNVRIFLYVFVSGKISFTVLFQVGENSGLKDECPDR
jgi:hypothetical protein